MSVYKLFYFNVRMSRGETPRMMFAYAKQAFEDHRIDILEWEQKRKEVQPPFSQLPVLKVDGETFSQSKTIGRLLADRFGLRGGSDLQRAKVDMVNECLDDIIVACIHGAGNRELTERLRDVHMPGFLKKLDNIHATFSGGKGHWVGDGVTWADLYFYNTAEFFEEWFGRKLDMSNTPRLVENMQLVRELPTIAQYLKDREKVQYNKIEYHVLHRRGVQLIQD